MKQTIQRHVRRKDVPLGLLLYGLGAFGICWLCMGLVVLDSRHVITLGSSLLTLGLKGLGNFGPTLSALGVTALLFGEREEQALLARCLRWKVNVLWYAIALCLPFVMSITGVALAIPLHGVTSEQGGILSPTFVGLLSVVVAPVGEELGWRGFALPRLQLRLGPAWASVFLGITWGIWHLPFFLLPTSSEAMPPFILFLGSCVAETFIFTWLFNRTGGSVIICMVYHAATNLALKTIPLFPHTQDASILPSLLFTGVEGVVALAIFLIPRVRR